MTDQDNSPRSAALQELEAAVDEHRRAQADPVQAEPALPGRAAGFLGRLRAMALRARRLRLPSNIRIAFDPRHPVVRKLAIVAGVLVVLVTAGGGVLVWRLSSGPISLDLITPWLTSAIEENFGTRYRVQVGGTQLERDAQGRTAIRLLNIVVRDAAGASVAVAPKAEVGISGTSLLLARPRAESLRLVDANMVIRVSTEGRVDVFAGGERPFASISPGAVPEAPAAPGKFSLQSVAAQSATTNLLALMAWLDGVSGLGRDSDKANQGGLDGYDLTEFGIINGSLTIDDRRSAQEWKFHDIGLRLIRPRDGGIAFSVGSENQERPWLLNASLTPGPEGHRRLQLEARKVLLDDLFALRMVQSRVRSDTLVSAAIEADIAANGKPQTLAGTILAEGGAISDPDDPEVRMPIGSAEFRLDWDASRGTLRLPFKVVSGGARLTLRSEFAAPKEPGANWMFAVGGGWILLDPATPEDEGLALKRVAVRGQIDPNKQRITLEQADLGTTELGGSKGPKEVSVALSGTFDYAGDQPRLAIGLAGNQMAIGALKRIWPVFIAPDVRDWVLQHVISGTVERIDIATNTPVEAMRASGPPIADDGLSVEIVTSSTTLRPVNGLPVIRDADLTARITGRTATIALGKGTIDVSPGKRLAISQGVFEVPDTRPTAPPAQVRFRLEGPVPAAAELLEFERLKEFAGSPFDPATTRGTLSAQVNLGMPLKPDLPRGSTNYNIAVDLANFSADRLMMVQKVEAQMLRVTANNQGSQIKGDVRLNGTPAQLDYRKLTAEPEAELRIAATLDEAARAKLGIDLGTSVSGAFPVRLAGRVGPGPNDASRFNVEADLTPIKIDNLLPGWAKPAGKPARMTFMLTRDKNANRFDDILIDGQGVLAKGTVEVDAKGDLQTANFPVFATSDGDKATLKADRGPDGALRVVMRGDVFDGRSFVKSSMSGAPDSKTKSRQTDVDLDIRLGVVAGYHGETLRSLDLRMSRRAGRIRSFALNAKIGRDTALLGEIRNRVNTNRPVLYFETADAGALFRFTDVYPRMMGGRIWVAMDPPTQEQTPQDGMVNLRDFAIRGEGALDRVVSNAPNAGRNSIEFTQARAEFTKIPGRVMVRDGVVRGPMIGATMEGNIDYGRDDVNMRGTLVPLYGINNMFGQIPIVGLFLGGGSNEGLLGITYEVTGATSNPRMQVNPLSAIAPGLLRKFFEFRDNSNDRTFAEPTR